MSNKNIDKAIRKAGGRGRSISSGPPKLDEVSRKMGDFIRHRPGEADTPQGAADKAKAKEGTIEQALGIDAPITEEQAEELGLVEGDIDPKGRVYRKPKRVSNKALKDEIKVLTERLDKLEGADND